MARQPGHVVALSSSVYGASGTSSTPCYSDTARTLEVWIDVTAVAAGDFNFELQVGLKSADYATDTDWKTVKTLNNVTATGKYVLLAVRETEPLGELARIKYTRNAGTLTFSVAILSKED